MAKKPQSKKGGKPQRTAAAPTAPPEVLAAARSLQQLARESPEGWGTIARALKEQPEADPDALLQFLALNLGKEVLPLLRGAALDEDEELALAALGALPLLGTRAAGDILVEAFQAHSEGERGNAAWKGVEALQARGINVSVPKPEGAGGAVPQYTVKETWESLTDGVGSRETVARLQDRYGVWHSAVLVWNDRAGVKDGAFIPMSRREWDQLREQNQREGALLISVPAEFARWQVQRARELNAKSGFALDDHLDAWDAHVGADPGDYAPEDPLAAVRALPKAQQADLSGHLDCLMEGDEFYTWAFEPADCQPWLERWQALVDEAEDATGDEAAVAAADEKIEGLLSEMAGKLVTPEFAALWRARLADSVRKLNWAGRSHEAQVAAAVALELDETGNAASHSFFLALGHSSLEALEEFIENGEDPEKLRYDPMAPVESA